MAAVTCLLSGLRVFGSPYSEQERCLRLVKGIHGLHVYSTEYWAEYILEGVASNPETEIASFLALANCLAERLATGTISRRPMASFLVKDTRLFKLKQHPLLKMQIENSLFYRSQERLESDFIQHTSKLSTMWLKNCINDNR